MGNKGIRVRKVNDKNWRVGDKLVYEDMDGDLIAKVELTELEKEAFYKHLGRNYPNNKKGKAL